MKAGYHWTEQAERKQAAFRARAETGEQQALKVAQTLRYSSYAADMRAA